MNEKSIFIAETNKLRNEGLTIEYKESFNFGSLAKYFKTLMAFANNTKYIMVDFMVCYGLFWTTNIVFFVYKKTRA